MKTATSHGDRIPLLLIHGARLSAREAGFANFHLNPPSEVHSRTASVGAPLLIVGNEKENTVPASLSKKQYEKYESSPAQTDYVEPAGRPHLAMVGKGWEEIAGGIETWLSGVLAAEPARSGGASA